MTLPMQSFTQYFTGRWDMARRIRDRLRGEPGQLTGVAAFVPVAGGLRYEETGAMILGAYRGEVSQRYWFVPVGDFAAAVRHADGRPFHHLDLGAGPSGMPGADVVHECGADRYRGRYRLLGPDRWTLVWRVTGPHKDYLLATDYKRCAL